MIQNSDILNNNFDIKNKSFLVTGASSGIGRQIAIDLSNNGAFLIITGRNENRLKETLDNLKGENHKMIVCDFADIQSITNLVAELPKLNGIVHAAGITNHLPARFISETDISQVFQVNFNGPVLLTGQIIRKKLLDDQASIVFLSSMAPKYAYFGGSIYASSKAAIETYARTLAVELASKKIRVNCIQPSFVKTPLIENMDTTLSNEFVEQSKKLMLLGFIDIEDIAQTVIFLLSDASKWITGANIPIGGG